MRLIWSYCSAYVIGAEKPSALDLTVIPIKSAMIGFSKAKSAEVTAKGV